MANGSSRVFSIVLALVIGLAAGWFFQMSIFTPKGTKAILVGPKASDLTIPKIKISKRNQDVLFWAAKNKDQQLWIELDDDIFDGTTSPGAHARYRVQCAGRRCFSGEIKPGASEEGHKYWQILLDSAGKEVDSADGMIIIDK